MYINYSDITDKTAKAQTTAFKSQREQYAYSYSKVSGITGKRHWFQGMYALKK
jgi:hypothetical protein